MTTDHSQGVTLRRVPTDELSETDVAAVRAILWAAFADDDGGMTEEDWDHARGGVHVLAEQAGRIVAHAAVVERDIRIAGRPVRTGYVEAVAVDPGLQRSGLGSAVMGDVAAIIIGEFELGALGTGSPEFYERLGWRRWRGPTSVRTDDGERMTPDEDGGILVLETSRTPGPLDLDAPISCEWRPGDVW
jgi:aminoglycoside 2'-N-acetyltransferase I